LLVWIHKTTCASLLSPTRNLDSFRITTKFVYLLSLKIISNKFCAYR
jgi:hypothetical protein